MSETVPLPQQRALVAEAAAWLARLHSDARSGQDEAAFRAWLAEDDSHAAAFLHVTAVWEAVPGLEGTPDTPERAGLSWPSRRAVLAGSLAVAAAGAIGGGAWLLRGPRLYSTGIGEQRRVALDDGSSLLLDTDSMVRVRMSAERREIDLMKGRAHFAVAKDSSRPFVVRAGQQQVVALGTAFDVDREDDDTTVVLIEGRVAVRALRRGSASPERLMVPGDRLRFRRDELTGVDRPDMTVMSAWQTGRLIFAGETLLAAAREFNRYNKRHLVVADSALAAMQVSGVYDVDNPEGFARSIGFLLPIAARIDGDTITLSRIE